MNMILFCRRRSATVWTMCIFLAFGKKSVFLHESRRRNGDFIGIRRSRSHRSESLTAGTPVLSTRTGGVAELLPDEYGWIIENDLLSIIDGMTAIYDDRKLLEEENFALRSYAYNNERIKASLDALFQTSEERGRAVMNANYLLL